MGYYAYLEAPIALAPQELALFAAAAGGRRLDFSKQYWFEWARWTPEQRAGFLQGSTLSLQDPDSAGKYHGDIWLHHLREDGTPVMVLSLKVDTGPNLPRAEALRRLCAIAHETGGVVRYEDQEPVLVQASTRLPFCPPMRFNRRPLDAWQRALRETCERITKEMRL